jgi:hypothetical protein
MSKKKKIIPETNMLVGIPLSNSQYGLGIIAKVIDLSGGVFHTIWGLYDITAATIEELRDKIHNAYTLKKPFLVCGMDYEELEKGKWPVIGKYEVKFDNINLNDERIFNALCRENIPGALLLEMYLGLEPWDLFKDPNYLDSRLLPGYSRPLNVKLK